MTKSIQQRADKMGWRLRTISGNIGAIKKDSQITPVDFFDFELRLVSVGEYIRDILKITPYGIGGADDYSTKPKRGDLLGRFSIYVPTHDDEGLMSFLELGIVNVFTHGEIGTYMTAYGLEDNFLEKKLREEIATKRVTKKGKIVLEKK